MSSWLIAKCQIGLPIRRTWSDQGSADTGSLDGSITGLAERSPPSRSAWAAAGSPVLQRSSFLGSSFPRRGRRSSER